MLIIVSIKKYKAIPVTKASFWEISYFDCTRLHIDVSIKWHTWKYKTSWIKQTLSNQSTLKIYLSQDAWNLENATNHNSLLKMLPFMSTSHSLPGSGFFPFSKRLQIFIFISTLRVLTMVTVTYCGMNFSECKLLEEKLRL